MSFQRLARAGRRLPRTALRVIGPMLLAAALGGCQKETTVPGPPDESGFTHGHSVGQRPGDGPAVGESIRRDLELFGGGEPPSR